jgi:hypothetical protein
MTVATEATVINVLPSDTVLVNTTCPTGYTGLCVNSVESGLHLSSNGDTVKVYGSHYYVNASSYWGSHTYIAIDHSIVFTSNNGSSVIEFSGCGSNPNTTVGITINHDNVNVTNLNFTSNCILSTLVHIAYNTTVTQTNNGSSLSDQFSTVSARNVLGSTDRSKRIAMIPGDYNVVSWPTDSRQQRQQQQQQIETNEYSIFSSRIPVPIDQPCSSCFCGCGKETTPPYVRYNVTIRHCSFVANASLGIITAGNTYGLSGLLVQNNVMVQTWSDTYLHVFINNTYVANGVFTFNHYGKCVYPRINVNGCDSTTYLPYYIDSALTLSAPLVDSSGTAYINLVDAVDSNVGNISLRGDLYMDSQVVVSRALFRVSVSSDHACCATIHIPDNMNPAFTVTYPSMQLDGVTLSLGNNAGGIMMRNGAAQFERDLTILTYPSVGINVTVYDLLPITVARSLLSPYRPSYIPRTPYTVMLNEVQIVSEYGINDTLHAFKYAVLVMPMNPSIWTKLSIQNCMIEGGQYGVVNRHLTTSLSTNLIRCNHAVVANDTGSYTNNNFVISNTGVVDIQMTNHSTVSQNQFFMLGNNCNPIYPPDVGLGNGNRYIIQNQTSYVLYSSFSSNTLVGLAGLDEVKISVTHYSSCDYIGRALFVPNATASPFSRSTSVSSFYSIYSSFSLGDHRLSMSRYKKDIGALECNGIAMYTGQSEGGPTSWSIGGDLGTDGISTRDMRVCGSINYTMDSVLHNAVYQLSYGPSIIYVCPTYNTTDANHTRTLEDAVFIAEPGSIIKLCNGTHTVTSCVTVDKAVEITNDLNNGVPTLKCATNSTCCCLVDVTPQGGGTTVSRVVFQQDLPMYIGDSSCCYPSALRAGADATGSTIPGSYMNGECTTGLTVELNTFRGFKNAMRIGCASNVSIYENTVTGSVGGILILTTGYASATVDTIWQDYIDGSDLAYNTYFEVINNTVTNTTVGISNQDLQGTAPTTACRSNAISYSRTGYIPPWNVAVNLFDGVDAGVVLRGVNSFQGFPVTIVSNNISAQVSTVSYVPPAFDIQAPVSFVLDMNEMLITLNTIANHDVVISTQGMEMTHNNIQDSWVNVTDVSSYFVYQQGSALQSEGWTSVSVSENNLCFGNLTAKMWISTLIPANGELFVGFNSVLLTANKIPSLDRLSYVTNKMGVPQNVLVRDTVNCVGTSIQPNLQEKQYLLPGLIGNETTVFDTCAAGSLPSPTGLWCIECTSVDLTFDATVNLANSFCLVFSGGLPSTSTTTTTARTTGGSSSGGESSIVSTTALSWIIPLGVIAGVMLIIMVAVACTMYNAAYKDTSAIRKRS